MKNIIFDFGGVLVDWNPRYLYRKIFADEQEMEWFLQQVCPPQWNALLDAGLPFEEAIAERKEKYPRYAQALDAYFARWDEMMGGEVPGTAAIVQEVKSKGYPVFGLSNWSAQTFPLALKRFAVFGLLDGRVLSGEEKINKPDERIYRRLLERFNLKAQECLFIDDTLPNILQAQKMGFETIHFKDAPSLRKELQERKVI